MLREILLKVKNKAADFPISESNPVYLNCIAKGLIV